MESLEQMEPQRYQEILNISVESVDELPLQTSIGEYLKIKNEPLDTSPATLVSKRPAQEIQVAVDSDDSISLEEVVMMEIESRAIKQNLFCDNDVIDLTSD